VDYRLYVQRNICLKQNAVPAIRRRRIPFVLNIYFTDKFLRGVYSFYCQYLIVANSGGSKIFLLEEIEKRFWNRDDRSQHSIPLLNPPLVADHDIDQNDLNLCDKKFDLI
jgi:hypothetical protein